MAGGILLAGRGPETAVLPSTGPGASASTGAATGDGTRADDAAALLTRLTRALRDGSRADVVALAAPGDPRGGPRARHDPARTSGRWA